MEKQNLTQQKHTFTNQAPDCLHYTARKVAAHQRPHTVAAQHQAETVHLQADQLMTQTLYLTTFFPLPSK